MITAYHFLKIFPLFRDAPCELVDELIAASVYHQFEKNAFIYMEGDVCPGIAFILSGEIRVYKVGEGGKNSPFMRYFQERPAS